MRAKKLTSLLAAAAFSWMTAALPASAANAPYYFAGYYQFAWNGIPVGGLTLEATEQAGRYSLAIDTFSSGLASMFAKHRTVNTSEGAATAKGYSPSRFDSSYTLRKKTKTIHMEFADGVPIAIVLTPPDKPNERPAISATQLRGAVDPLTLFFAGRNGLRQAQESGANAYSVKVHDGRRVSQLDFTIQGKETLRIAGRDEPVIGVRMKRKPLAGFQDKELKKIAKEAAIDFYFADRTDLLPLQLVMPINLGSLKGTLKKVCQSRQECLK